MKSEISMDEKSTTKQKSKHCICGEYEHWNMYQALIADSRLKTDGE